MVPKFYSQFCASGSLLEELRRPFVMEPDKSSTYVLLSPSESECMKPRASLWVEESKFP